MQKSNRISVWFHNSLYLLKFTWKHWDFLKFMIQSSKRKKEIQKRDLKRDDFLAIRPPTEVNLYLTDNCNLRCQMCPFWGDHGNRKSFALDNLAQTALQLHDYQKLVEDLKGQPTFYYLSGGEPTLYREGITKLLEILKRFNNRVALNTNGTTLERYAEDFVRLGLDLIIVSVDGPEAIHDSIRGVKGTFKQLERGIAKLKVAQNELRRINPVISTLFTVNSRNYSYLMDMVRINNHFGVDMAGITFSSFTTEELGNSTVNLKRKLFQSPPNEDWRGFLIDTANIDVKELETQFKAILKAKKDFMFYTMPADLKPEQVFDYYRNVENTFGYELCWKPWYRTYIRPNGLVESCEFFSPNKLGNIREASILDIWNGELYRQYRKALLDVKHFPYCARCFELYPP